MTESNPVDRTPRGPSAGAQALGIIGFVTLGVQLWLGRAIALGVGADGTGLALALGTFLLGTAVGSAIAGRVRSGPFAWSVAALISVVVTALWVEFGMPHLVEGWTVAGGWPARIVGALPVAIPAALLGGVPIAWFGAGHLDASGTRERVGGWIGLLDLGSAGGALALPLVLLPLLGATATLVTLCGLLAVATYAARHARGGGPDDVTEEPRTLGSRLPIAATVGAVTLGLQLAATRLLGEMFGTSLTVLGVATAASLVGGAIAAKITPRTIERHGREATIAGALILWLVAQCFSAAGLALLPEMTVGVLSSLGAEPGGAPTAIKLIAVVVILLPPSLASGLVLPTLLAGWCRSPAELRRDAGPLQAAWLIGAAFGAVVIGVGVLPGFGSGIALVSLSVVTAVVAMGAAFRRRALVRPAVVGLVLSLLLGATAIARWDPALLGAGVFHWSRIDLAAGRALEDWREREVTYVGEGALAKVSIEVAPAQNTAYLRVGGRVEGSVPIDPEQPSLGDLPTAVMLGVLPTVEGSGKGELLVVGVGGGTTLSAAVDAWDGPITALEVEPEVIRALESPAGAAAFSYEHARIFPDGTEGPRLVYEDARSFLGRDTRQWDAIVCQPSEPWLPWSAPLFTRDFYHLVRDRLHPEGVAIQWLQLYRIGPREFVGILEAFREAFPEARLYHPPGTGEVLLVGGPPAPLAVRASRFRGTGPQVAWARLRGAPFPRPLADRAALERFSGAEGTRSGGDLRSRLEFRLPLLGDRGEDRSLEILQGLRDAARSP